MDITIESFCGEHPAFEEKIIDVLSNCFRGPESGTVKQPGSNRMS